MEIEQLLKDTLNLSEYQILVYLSLLEKTGTAGQLFRRLNINRATLYRVLEELSLLSLVIKKQIKTRMYFEALHPDSLRELYEKRRITFEEKGRALERVVHELLRKATSQPTDASITIEKGIPAHFRRMKMKLNCKEKIIRQKVNNDSSIYDYQDYPETKDYMEFIRGFITERVSREIHLKLLVHTTLSPLLKPLNTSIPEELKEARILPAEILPDVSFEVYDDYTVFVVRHGNPEDMVIITIRNAITAELMKSLFDFVFDRSIVSYNQNPIPIFITNSNIKLPLLGIGTSGIGGYWNGAHPYVDDTGDVDQIRHALSKGVNYIDACLMYGEGHTVELISRAIRNIGRGDLFINAKLTRVGGEVIKSINEVEEQCNRYLKVLNTDYIDQFQIHSRRSLGNVNHNEIVEKIGDLIKSGKVKHWGVSNYKTEDIKEAMTFIREPILSNEIPYGVFIRDYEVDGTLDIMRLHNISTISYFTVRKGGMMIDSHFNSDTDSLLQVLAKKYQHTPTQIAINWVVNHSRTMALIKSTNGTHVNENVASVGWKMSEEDYESITRLTP